MARNRAAVEELGKVTMRKISLALCLAVLLGGVSDPARASDWNDIDCSQSKLEIPGFRDLKCQRGPDWESTRGCVAENYLAGSQSGDFTLQLTAIRTWKNCLIKTSSDLDYEIKTYFSWAANASGWGSYRELAGATGATMINRGDNCFTFYKPGPARNTSEESGFAWVLHGVFCVAGTRTLDDQAVASFINSIQVKE